MCKHLRSHRYPMYFVGYILVFKKKNALVCLIHEMVHPREKSTNFRTHESIGQSAFLVNILCWMLDRNEIIFFMHDGTFESAEIRRLRIEGKFVGLRGFVQFILCRFHNLLFEISESADGKD